MVEPALKFVKEALNSAMPHKETFYVQIAELCTLLKATHAVEGRLVFHDRFMCLNSTGLDSISQWRVWEIIPNEKYIPVKLKEKKIVLEEIQNARPSKMRS